MYKTISAAVAVTLLSVAACGQSEPPVSNESQEAVPRQQSLTAQESEVEFPAPPPALEVSLADPRAEKEYWGDATLALNVTNLKDVPGRLSLSVAVQSQMGFATIENSEQTLAAAETTLVSLPLAGILPRATLDSPGTLTVEATLAYGENFSGSPASNLVLRFHPTGPDRWSVYDRGVMEAKYGNGALTERARALRDSVTAGDPRAEYGGFAHVERISGDPGFVPPEPQPAGPHEDPEGNPEEPQ